MHVIQAWAFTWRSPFDNAASLCFVSRELLARAEVALQLATCIEIKEYGSSCWHLNFTMADQRREFSASSDERVYNVLGGSRQQVSITDRESACSFSRERIVVLPCRNAVYSQGQRHNGTAAQRYRL